MKKITIQDIAAELKLSRNTVAKALNNGAVSYETRITVIKCAQAMGYSKLSASLIEEVENIDKHQKGGTVLVLFDRSESIFWNKILMGISDECNEKGFRMQLHIVDEQDKNADEARKLIAEDVKGIIFLCVFPITFVEGLSKAKIPMIFLDAPANAAEFLKFGDVITVEGWYTVCEMVNTVIKRGKTKFAFIGYENGSKSVHDRYGGFMQALRANNLTPDKKLLFTEKVPDDYYHYTVIENLVNNLPYMPEVFVCTNDDIVRYVAIALSKIDEKLAEDVTLIGFDNTIEETFFKKGIITANIRKEAVGRRLVRALTYRMQDPAMDYALTAVVTYPMYN
jgi:LacI family transcriptional regulator